MRLSYISTYDSTDIAQWSGLGYNISKALENQGASIDYISTLNNKSLLYPKLKLRLYQLVGKKYLVDRDLVAARYNAAQAGSKIKADTDIIFSPGTLATALLKTNKPKVFYTDATFAGMINFYQAFTNLSQKSIANGNFLEQEALSSSALAIYSSDWAAQTAIDNYNVDPSKIKVVPFGANIDCALTLAEVKNLVAARSKKECNLLFMGVDWERKGAEIAIKVAGQLNESGLKAKLHLAGIRNVPVSLPDFVVNYGFLSKSNKEDRDKIIKLLSLSHFLILPSKADCTPIVYAEANSYGLPVITTNVGGVATLIKPNVNGQYFSLTDAIQDYTRYIFEVFSDEQRYCQMCYDSFNEYKTRLNWTTAGKTIMKYLKEI
jgi:glycosyltransferase involved in cell wall biosynthesis